MGRDEKGKSALEKKNDLHWSRTLAAEGWRSSLHARVIRKAQSMHVSGEGCLQFVSGRQ